jgi:hypothetical protein
MQLLYRAGFENGALKPLYDPSNLGPLQFTEAPQLPGTARETVAPPALQLELTRAMNTTPPGPQVDDCYAGAVLYPFSDSSTYFQISATFELAGWVTNESVYGWAMALFARTGDAQYYPTRAERTTVTLRSARQPAADPDIKGYDQFAILNWPGGLPKGGGSVIPGALYADIFESNDPARSRVTLELLIDRKTKIARASLLVPSAAYRQRRWFTHDLVTNLGTPGAAAIETVGFVIAIASGVGTASATVREFRIHRLSLLDMFIARLGDAMARLLGFIHDRSTR